MSSSRDNGGALRLEDAGAGPATQPARGTMEQAFPEVEVVDEPTGSRVLIQVRTPMTHFGNIELLPETKDTEQWNTEVGRVAAVGPLCFKNRDTGEPWPEGAWFRVGDFVRCPKYGGTRFEQDVPGTKNRALFAFFQEADIVAVHRGDPLAVIAYLK